MEAELKTLTLLAVAWFSAAGTWVLCGVFGVGGYVYWCARRSALNRDKPDNWRLAMMFGLGPFAAIRLWMCHGSREVSDTNAGLVNQYRAEEAWARACQEDEPMDWLTLALCLRAINGYEVMAFLQQQGYNQIISRDFGTGRGRIVGPDFLMSQMVGPNGEYEHVLGEGVPERVRDNFATVHTITPREPSEPSLWEPDIRRAPDPALAESTRTYKHVTGTVRRQLHLGDP